jgi:hypothetical protein
MEDSRKNTLFPKTKKSNSLPVNVNFNLNKPAISIKKDGFYCVNLRKKLTRV